MILVRLIVQEHIGRIISDEKITRNNKKGLDINLILFSHTKVIDFLHKIIIYSNDLFSF